MQDNETPKRLAPTQDTLRELFLKSGNLCAFPGCNQIMMDIAGNFIGQICHIEAAEPNGPRFNSLMSNEERRHVSNLMLMCYQHHKITDNVDIYTKERLKEIKDEHEKTFSAPERFMTSLLQDSTKSNQPTFPNNLKLFFRILDLDSVDQNDKDKLREDICDFISNFCYCPHEVRHNFSLVLERIMRQENATNIVIANYDEKRININDLMHAFSLDRQGIYDFTSLLETYNLASVHEEQNPYRGNKDYYLSLHTIGDWPFWSDLMEFCKKTNQNIRGFTMDMNFSQLDE